MKSADLTPTVHIRVRGRIPTVWMDSFHDLSIVEEQDPDGVVTCLSGQFQDQSALQGTLNNLYSLGLALVSLQTRDEPPPH